MVSTTSVSPSQRPIGCHKPFSPAAALNRGVPSGHRGVGFGSGGSRRFCAGNDVVGDRTKANMVSDAAIKRNRTCDLRLLVDRITGARGGTEFFACAGHRDVLRVDILRSVLGEETFHYDFVPD